MKIGIYLGDIKKPESIGDLTFEYTFVKQLLKTETNHKFVFYYFGKKNIFKNTKDIKFVCLKYYKKPEVSFRPFQFKVFKTPFVSLNHKMKKDSVDVAFFLVPYLHEHIEIPYFAVVRDVAHRILPHFPEFITNSMFEKKEKKLNLFLTGASKIITCNNIAKNDIKTLYDVIDENIIILNLPYPDWLIDAKDDETVLKENNLSKNNYIFYPAQFWAHKNHIRLLLAKQLMKEHNINLKLVFTGFDRGNKNYIKNKTDELNIADEVLFLDYVDRNKLASLYKNAYAVIYPSLAGPDSIVALEALYFDCPLLISNLLGYNEQLKNSALYFNPLDEADIVEKIVLLNDIAIKDEIIANGKNLIKANNSKKYIDRIINILDNFYSIRQCWSLDEDCRG